MQPAFETFVRRTEASLRAYIAGLGVPSHAVDDVAQEAYLAVFARGTLPEGAEPVAWLKGCARNQVFQHFRNERRERARRLEAIAVQLEAGAARSDADHLGGEERPARLHACLERLKDGERLLLNLRYQQGLPAEAIAELRQSSPGAIRIALMRIRDRLRLCLSAAPPDALPAGVERA